MVNPKEVTNFTRTNYELLEFALFALFVAGKNSDVTAKKLEAFLDFGTDPIMRESAVRLFALPLPDGTDALDFHLRKFRIGQYTRLGKSIRKLLSLDLRSCTLSALEEAIGPKSARFFLLHSRKDAECAALDTHILRWMSDVVGPVNRDNIPKATPTNMKEYRRLEKLFISFARGIYKNMSLAEADLRIWKEYSGRA